MLNKVIISVGNDTDVEVEITNGYLLNIRFSRYPKVISKEDNIISLQLGEGSISLFTQLRLPIDNKIESVYEIIKIEKLTDRAFRLLTTIETKTKQFILPCLEKTREYFLYDTFLENAFIKLDNNDITNLEFPLILLYRYSESELYKQFELNITKHNLFSKMVDINPYEVLFIFNIEEYKKDIDCFIRGKYSEISSKLKKEILKFHNYSEDGTMGLVLNKHPKLREQLEIHFNTPIHKNSELYSIPDIGEETFKLYSNA